MAAAVWFIIPRNFSEQKAISRQEDNSINVDNIPEAFFNRNIKLLMVSVFVFGAVGYGYMGLYVSFLVRQMHFSTVMAATAFSFYGFGTAFPWLWGWLGDRFSNRGALIIAYCGMAMTTYLLFNVATKPVEHYVLSVFQAICYSILHVNHFALFQKSVRPDKLGRATGLFTSAHFLSGAFAGNLFGALVSRLGWGAAGLIQGTMLSIAGFFVILMINPKTQLQVK
jgi:MFS family permease